MTERTLVDELVEDVLRLVKAERKAGDGSQRDAADMAYADLIAKWTPAALVKVRSLPAVDVEKEAVFSFLLGQGPLEGVWFGDKPEGTRGAFWWRRHLRAALSTQAETVRERAAKMAECHFDDRPRRDGMDWNDGYQDGCRGAAQAIRSMPLTGEG